MPEILTESFCERCGTRYTFESAAPRTARLKGIKVMSRGLKNFVMSDDTSMDEAMAAARSETDREATAQQLDAFHKTFNFCMSCRQYTCGNCWNEVDGQCLSCSPHLGHEIMPAPFPDLDATAGVMLAADTNGSNGSNGHVHDDGIAAMAWPTSDLMREAEALDAPAEVDAPDIESIDATARLAALGAFDAIAPDLTGDDATISAVEPEMDAIAPPELEVEAAAMAVEATQIDDAAPPITEAATAPAEPAVPTPPAASVPGVASVDPEDVDGRAAAAAGRTTAMLHRFRPGQSLDDEIAAYEREQAAAEAATGVPLAPAAPGPADEPVTPLPAVAAAAAAAAVEPSPTEPVHAEPDDLDPGRIAAAAIAAAAVTPPTPEPAVRAEPAPAPIAAELPSAPMAAEAPAPAPVDIVPQPTWQVVAPDAPTADGVPAPAIDAPVVPAPEPQWPTSPEWPSQRPSSGLAFLGRPAAPTGGLESLWAESAREVASAAPSPAAAVRPTSGVAPCISCGLSLSATARFCRRCGTRQG